MEILNICPSCGVPSVKVTHKTINFFLKDHSIHKFNQTEKYFACVNPECSTAYYSQYIIIDRSEIKYPLWYKSSDRNVFICYCSKLTRGEIYDAVDNGCSKIDEIRKRYNKEQTGSCEEKNPLGKCCQDVFLFTIDEAMEGNQK